MINKQEPFWAVLAEAAPILEGQSQALLGKWVNLYLSTFSRKAFLSPERVSNIYEELLTGFLRSLRSRDSDAAAAEVRAKGEGFFEAGVPFEEVILSLGLFEEACVSVILENRKALKHKLEDVLVALEEFGHAQTAALAVNYYRASKKHWQKACRGYQEEAERLRGEVQSLHEEFYLNAKNDLQSMEVIVRGISQRLRKSVILSRRIQAFSELLEQEGGLRNALKISDKFFRQILPRGAEVFFGLFDENQKKLALYHAAESDAGESAERGAPGIIEELYFSQLPLEFQEILFDGTKATAAFHDPKRLSFLAAYPGFLHGAEFVFLPLRKYRDSLGFLLLSSPERDVFTKSSMKYYLRLAKTLAQALFGIIYFTRSKKHGEFTTVMDELQERVLQRNPVESTLDYCLGALIELISVERASLMLLDKKERSLSVYAAKGYKVFPFSGLVLKWGEGVAGWSVRESKIVSIPRMREDGRAARRDGADPSPRELQVRSLLCVPLVHEDEVVGVLNLSTITYQKQFEQSEIDMTSQFARKIAMALSTLASVKDVETYLRPHLRYGEEIYP